MIEALNDIINDSSFQTFGALTLITSVIKFVAWTYLIILVSGLKLPQIKSLRLMGYTFLIGALITFPMGLIPYIPKWMAFLWEIPYALRPAADFVHAMCVIGFIRSMTRK